MLCVAFFFHFINLMHFLHTYVLLIKVVFLFQKVILSFLQTAVWLFFLNTFLPYYMKLDSLVENLRISTATIIKFEEEFKLHTTGFIHKLLQRWLELQETQEQSNMFTFLLAAIDKSMKSIDTKWVTKIMVRVHKEGRALTENDLKKSENTKEATTGEIHTWWIWIKRKTQ